MTSHLLARFTKAIERHHASRTHPDDELDHHLRTRPVPTEQEDEQQRRRRELRGVPVLAQDAGQPNDERGDPLAEVLRRERKHERRSQR